MSRSDARELLDRLGSEDDAEAWSEFLESYSALLLQIIDHFERDRESAEDCFIFVCERLSADRSRRLRQYDQNKPASFEGWLSTVVRNLCIDWLRKRLGRRRPYRAIERLSVLDQEVFRCVYQEHLSIAATLHRLSAEHPGLDEKSVERALGEIRRALTTQHLWLLSNQGVRAPLDGLQEESAAESTPDPESRAIRQEQLGVLADAMEELEPEERLILQLRFEQDLTLGQVARMLGLNTAGAADRRIRTVLKRLRRRLEPKSEEESAKTRPSVRTDDRVAEMERESS